MLNNTDCYRKILALPEHFSPEHLQDIVDGKLKDKDEVLIECEKTYYCLQPGCNIPGRCLQQGKPTLCDQESYKNIKLNPHITIYPVEEKMHTKQQIINYLKGFTEAAPLSWIIHNLEDGDNLEKWIEYKTK